LQNLTPNDIYTKENQRIVTEALELWRR